MRRGDRSGLIRLELEGDALSILLSAVQLRQERDHSHFVALERLGL